MVHGAYNRWQDRFVPKGRMSVVLCRIGPVGYDLIVWEGEQPITDAALSQKLNDITEMRDNRYERNEEPEPPTPTIADFMRVLLRRWPEDDQDGGPWKVGGGGDADGPTVHIGIIGTRAGEVVPFIALLAQAYGLVCFDRQTGCLMP
ncbi:hypothetical protein [Nocardia sp. NPDC056000]|uniref:hypothetical protein n=1 Tax=Nocardia sp. NPDC056000 TaxID=3345674 RepID=UPI0035D5C6E6